jgi:hypothetical protein
MRYITQFEVTKEELSHFENDPIFLNYQKNKSASELGLHIGDNIGFVEADSYDPLRKRYELEAEIFSMKEWQEFKKLLKEYVEASNELYSGTRVLDLVTIGKLVKGLESGTLLNIEQSVQECDATKAQSMREPMANNSPKEEDVEKMAEAAIPELKHIINTVSEARKLWIAGYNAAKTRD